MHAGVNTSELLGIYIRTIHAFKTLDPRGVLLEKVAQPMRAYLRDRDDTVKVIAASFLADLDDNGVHVVNKSDDICEEVTIAVFDAENYNIQSTQQTLDYDDMEWMPDPIDAGPGQSALSSNCFLGGLIFL